MRGLLLGSRVLTSMLCVWLLAPVVVLIAQDQPPVTAAVMGGGVACSPTVCDTPKAARPAAKGPHARAARPGPDVRRIFMRPPYNLSMRRIALTCGFHDSCKRYPDRLSHYRRGSGLDWNDNNGTWPETRGVYFTLSAHASRPGTRVATVTWEYHRAGRDYGYPCSTLVARVWSHPKPVELFRVMYQHVVPTRRLGPLRIYSVAATVPIEQSKPNVVVRIAEMSNDPCAFFTRLADGRPLYHVHVEPSRYRHPFVRYRANTSINRSGFRVIPDVNGCREACNGPFYPGPRFRNEYWKMWTYNWRWSVDRRSGTVVRTR